MKNLPYIISGIGLAIFGIAGSCDFIDHPIIAVLIVIGVFLILVGAYIERSWSFEEKEDFDCADRGSDDTDDGITYVTYDSDK